MKFSYTKNPESEYFIKNPNLTKKQELSSDSIARLERCLFKIKVILTKSHEDWIKTMPSGQYTSFS